MRPRRRGSSTPTAGCRRGAPALRARNTSLVDGRCSRRHRRGIPPRCWQCCCCYCLRSPALSRHLTPSWASRIEPRRLLLAWVAALEPTTRPTPRRPRSPQQPRTPSLLLRVALADVARALVGALVEFSHRCAAVDCGFVFLFLWKRRCCFCRHTNEGRRVSLRLGNSGDLARSSGSHESQQP